MGASIGYIASLKVVTIFYKNYIKKSTTTYLPIDFVLPIVKLIVKLKTLTKQKRGQLTKADSTKKDIKKI